MKNVNRIFPLLPVFLVVFFQIQAQSTFSPDDYIEFRNNHLNYTSSQILAEHPPQTVYYSQRQSPADLTKVPWFDTLNRHFQFTDDEMSMLKQQHFMVTERNSAFSWTDAFVGLYSSDIPLFLSSDFILSTLHSSYDAILLFLERFYLEPNLKELLHAMYEHYPEVADAYKTDEGFEEALEDADFFISVALSLAEGETWSPRYGSVEKFNLLLDAVKSEKMTFMPLFTGDTVDRKLDFTQFTPRGHYTEQYTSWGVSNMEDYFRAMMWLGRIDFLMTAPPSNPWEADWTDEQLLRMQLGALLVNETLYSCGKIANLEKHEEIISYLVGPDDNLSPAELHALSSENLLSPADLFSEQKFDAFKELLNASDNYGQKIMSNFFYVDPGSDDPGKLPVSFKLLGQKFLIDSYVFHEVVYDRIIFEGEKVYRGLPDPLDAMAALGNEDALALLKGEMEQYKYAANMASLQYLISAYDGDFWEQSLYNTWLDAIRTLNPPANKTGVPYFMKTTAWQHEKLNTQLVSWAQLRHDNILYGKQSYTGGTGCSYPYTYVEPYPELYKKISLFAVNAATFFDAALPGDVKDRELIISFFENYSDLIGRFEVIARKELNGTPLNDDEITFFKTMISEFMASGPSVTGWYTDFFFDIMTGLSWDFTVADVHTQPTDESGSIVGNVLHVGNGRIDMGVFLADNPCKPGQLMAFAGPVSSFHTKVTSGFERLTDEKWEQYFWSWNGETERPDWVASYLLDKDGKAYPTGRALKGAVYTGTDIEPEQNPVDYLLLFPNPAIDRVHLRFVVNREADCLIRVYNMQGRMVHKGHAGRFIPGEHDVLLPCEQWVPGLYQVQVQLGKEVFTRDLLIGK